MELVMTRLLLVGALFFAAPFGAIASVPAARFASVVRIDSEPARWVATGGGLLVFGDGDDRVTIVSEADPFGPRTLFVAPSPISGAILLGDHGYLIVEGEGLWALHLEEISQPELSGFLALQEALTRVELSGQEALFAGENHPIYSALLETPHICCLDGNGAGCDARESFPPASIEGGHALPVPEGVTAMARTGDWLLLAYPGRGIFRIPARFAPPGAFLKPWMALPEEVKGLATVGDLLLAAAGPRGLLVLAPGAPSQPGTLVAHLPLDAESIHSVGRRIYLAGRQGVFTALVESPQAVTWTVNVGSGNSFLFSPATVNITQGDSVRWVRISGIHSTTSGSGCTGTGLWSSPLNATKTSFTRLFDDAAGPYPYFCTPHCELGMTGQVNVAGGAVANSTPFSISPNRIVTSNQGADATVTWDATNCASTGYHILYGFGSTISSAMGTSPMPGDIVSAKCAIGTTGDYPWTAVPDPSGDASRFMWYLVVGDNGTTTEGSWGQTSASVQRGGAAASGFCALTVKSTAAVCGTP